MAEENHETRVYFDGFKRHILKLLDHVFDEVDKNKDGSLSVEEVHRIVL